MRTWLEEWQLQSWYEYMSFQLLFLVNWEFDIDFNLTTSYQDAQLSDQTFPVQDKPKQIYKLVILS